MTHIITSLCVRDRGCIDVCPVRCLTITRNAEDDDVRKRLSAPAVNPEQPLYASVPLRHTGRIMVKDEDVCVHCGLCAERCPTYAWDMEKFEVLIPHAGEKECLVASHSA